MEQVEAEPMLSETKCESNRWWCIPCHPGRGPRKLRAKGMEGEPFVGQPCVAAKKKKEKKNYLTWLSSPLRLEDKVALKSVHFI